MFTCKSGLTMKEDSLIVRKYFVKDYTDILESGYPFTSYLRPNFFTKIKNLFNKKEIEKIIVKTFLLNREEIILVACSKVERKAVGVITLRKITENLWGIWDIFVSPLWRGRRIASLLYQKSYELLTERKVQKAVGTVSVHNVASVKSIERNWQGFLKKRIFSCVINTPMIEGELVHTRAIKIRKLKRGEEKNLFEIYRECTGEEWCNFLEINQNNFLDRFFGLAYFEPIRKNLFTRLMIKNRVLVAERKGEIRGYGIYRTTRFFLDHSYLHLYIPGSKDFDNICSSLLINALDQSKQDGKNQLKLIYVGNSEIKKPLANFGFEIKESLVPYKYL